MTVTRRPSRPADVTAIAGVRARQADAEQFFDSFRLLVEPKPKDD